MFARRLLDVCLMPAWCLLDRVNGVLMHSCLVSIQRNARPLRRPMGPSLHVWRTWVEADDAKKYTKCKYHFL